MVYYLIMIQSIDSLPKSFDVIEEKKEVKPTSIFKRIIGSSLTWTVSALVIGALITAINPIIGSILLIATVARAIFCKPYRKKLVYEVSLAFGYCLSKVLPQKWPAYNKITDNIYLGRLPLKNAGDHKVLRKEGIGAVLSLVEHFENHSLGILSDPVTSEDWKALGITHLQLETPDFHPLSVDTLEKAVDFIKKQVGQGKKVYVHCKAGRGRSAAAVCANLYLNNRDEYPTLASAYAHLRCRRPIVSLRKNKLEIIRALDAKLAMRK